MKNKTSGKWLYRAPLILQTIIWIPTRVILKFFLRFEVHGIENLRGLRRPIIFAVNHGSELDPILVPAALPFLSSLAPTFFTSREREFYEKRGFQAFLYGGILFKIWGAYPVAVGVNDYEKSLKNHVDILEDRAGSICFFPEGAKTKDGNFLPAKGGISYLAHRTNTTIVPVAISGHFQMRKFDFFLRRRRVNIIFGEPMYAKDLFPKAVHDTHEYKIIAQGIMDHVRELHTLMNFLLERDKNFVYSKEVFDGRYNRDDSRNRVFDVLFVPFLNMMPSYARYAVERTHPSARGVIKHKTSYRALEILYSGGALSSEGNENFFQGIFRTFWFNTRNAKAVRNRLNIVKGKIKDEIHSVLGRKKDVHILSIASGSARAILESVAEINLPQDSSVHITFLDKSESAIEYSKKLAEEIKLRSGFKLKWVVDTASNFPVHMDEQPDIIEMVGLLDYFKYRQARKIFSVIYQNLSVGGKFITANIVDNHERPFVTNLVGWRMVYREPHELVHLALHSGFEKKNLVLINEPLNIHAVLIAEK